MIMSMAENNTHPLPSRPDPEADPSGSGGNGSGSTQRVGPPAQAPPSGPLKCPRCDSPNTKFCYYNNYSLRQPRHFCKTCRRYWTHGGSLRNVPVGGASRKPKNNNNIIINNHHHHLFNSNNNNKNKTLMKLPPGSSDPFANRVFGSGHVHVARVSLSSIESLSSINQEMHWKLQQQRLVSLIYDHHQDDDNHDNHGDDQMSGQDDKLLQKELDGVGPTEWLFDQTTSYVVPAADHHNYSTASDHDDQMGGAVVDNNHDGWNYLHHQFNRLH